MTKRAFVAGHPIAHSRSPLIHGHWLDAHGIAGSYERVDVTPDAFPGFLRALGRNGYVGGNVTIPHKEAAFRLVDAPTDRAQRLRAVNTVWLENGVLHGDNTDVTGFAESLDAALGRGWETGRALVLGAGGAARAVVAGLLDRGIPRVVVAARDLDKAAPLLAFAPARVTTMLLTDVPRALARTDLLVNATSLGMTGKDPLDLDLSPLPAHAAVADIVYAPLETPLLRDARARGLAAVDGLGMLLHQAAPGFERWFGVRPRVGPELRALVEADLEPARAAPTPESREA
ncbi:shikimate dehydrogenase [Salinarimonas ramus]|uniref:Shikimate dehydrogenase (NADP(+)) n=1 Tax=Salinarimonas ramus TaxID=690164 RepID=A0A917Q7X0_9HYPH|nr:shikimate dehydrogenase [Salinarimonas ramus]GGK34500.1 shikimate dehydrogenase (NADP(+)) [Salinarimonas ramus]